MSPLAQLFLRNRERLCARERTLWVNPPTDLPLPDFSAAGEVRWMTQDEGDRARLAAQGAAVEFMAFPPPNATFDRAILAQPREKSLLRMMAHALADRLGEGGTLFLGGEIRAGAKSAARHLEPWFERVDKVDSARHCVLYEARGARVPNPFDPEDYRVDWTLECGAGPLEIASYPGVFAHGGLDPGTRLLLDTLPGALRKAPGSALDLCCGAGVIGAELARRYPGLELLLIDSSALALAATAVTLNRNGLTGRVVASDGLRAATGRYDLVVSNPPFHAGHRERADLGTGVFDGVRNFLNPGGQFIMVGNRHLPWRQWMDATFGAHEVLASDPTYHVLSPTR